MAYNVSNDYRKVIYSGGAQHTAILKINNITIPTSQISKIEFDNPIFDKEAKMFYLGQFASNQTTIYFKNMNNIPIEGKINIQIGTKVNDEYEYVPMGEQIIDYNQDDYYNNNKIVCLDDAINTKTNIDISSFVPCTIEELLYKLGEFYNIEIGTYPNTNKDYIVSTYDNTLSGKFYFSMIAELMGGNLKIGRDNKLNIIPLKHKHAVEIDATLGKEWKLENVYTISKVTYDTGSVFCTFGDDTGNTLFIRNNNIFILDNYEQLIKNIYDSVVGTTIASVKTENYGDPSLDAYDIIKYKLDDKVYYTYNNSTLTYEMNIWSKLETSIPSKVQEQTTNVVESDDKTKIRKMQTQISQQDLSIKDLFEETDGLNNRTTTVERGLEGVKIELTNKVSDSELNEVIEEQTNSFEQKITDSENSIKLEVSNEIKNIQVGGTNLALNTNNGIEDWLWSLGTQGAEATKEEIIENGIKCCKFTRNTIENTSWSYIGYSNINRQKYLPNRQYTISFEVKSSVETSFRLSLRSSNNQNPLTAEKTTEIVDANNWMKLSVTLTTLSTLPEATNQILYIRNMNSSIETSYIFRNLKIEEGNKATDWSPAPEDKLDSNKFNKAELVLKLNSNESNAKLSADIIDLVASKILNILAGSTINLTANNIKFIGDFLDINSKGQILLTTESESDPRTFRLQNKSKSSTSYLNQTELKFEENSDGSARYGRTGFELYTNLHSNQFYKLEGNPYRLVLSKNNLINDEISSVENIEITPEELNYYDSSTGDFTSISSSYIQSPTIVESSQEKLKKNITKFTNALDVINDTDIYTYNLKSEDDSRKKHIGFVIGNDYKYSKKIVALDKDGNEIGADIYSMVSVSFEAIKSLEKQINELKEMIQSA